MNDGTFIMPLLSSIGGTVNARIDGLLKYYAVAC
jgi:hypothetical protein